MIILYCSSILISRYNIMALLFYITIFLFNFRINCSREIVGSFGFSVFRACQVYVFTFYLKTLLLTTPKSIYIGFSPLCYVEISAFHTSNIQRDRMASQKLEGLDEIDELIIKILKKAGKPLTTYQITKESGLSWSTIHTHLYKLMSLGHVSGELQKAKIGERKKRIWWLKEK